MLENDKRETVSKAGAIRRVAKNDPSISNRELKEAVHRLYGLTVESNQITHELGRYADRQFAGKLGKMQLLLARDFVTKIGDLRQAVRLLRLSQAGGN
jgi:hypothetical protein